MASPEVKKVVQAVMAEVKQRGRAQAEQNPVAERAADLATINSADEIPERVEALKRYRETVETMIGTLRAAPAIAAIRARRLGLDTDGVDEAFRTVNTGIEEAGATVIVRKLQAERNWANAVMEGLKLLADNPNLWSPEDAPDGTAISIYDKRFAARFREAANRIVEAERRTNEASRAIGKARGR